MVLVSLWLKQNQNILLYKMDYSYKIYFAPSKTIFTEGKNITKTLKNQWFTNREK